MKCDFSGWATKAGLKCKDGKTISHGAFRDHDGIQVPLVWQHGHGDVENVLGHAILEDRNGDVYAYCFFNDTPKAQHAAKMLDHKDVNALSIYANELAMRGNMVLHGVIRELSLVLAGANPGALIDSVTVRHGDMLVDLEDEAVIYTGYELEHSDDGDESEDDELGDPADELEGLDLDLDPDLEHAALGPDATVQDVLDTLDPTQLEVVMALLGEAAMQDPNAASHSGIAGSDTPDNAGTAGSTDQKDDTMDKGLAHNLFDGTDKDKGGKKTAPYLATSVQNQLFHDALNSKVTSLRDHLEGALPDYLEHGIEDIDLLFPDAKALSATPEFLQRRTEWVSSFLGATTKTPFSRIKTFSADITADQARAKGYITGEFKKEEFFPIAKRVTTPVTVYKKQKLDRDDLIDITDFDIVAWLKAEMRLMLDEEIARAGLIGDGRDISDEDKINEQNIRPIASDHELFTTQVYVNLGDSNSSIQELIDAIIKNRPKLRGSGLPTFYTTETVISQFLLLRDQVGRDIFRDVMEIATKLRVREIVSVEVMEEETDIIGVLVNPIDYTYGATSGGQVSLFDDFDIDYNQYKYLIETRCCGALTRLKSAMCIRRAAGNLVLVAPAEPAFDAEEGELTITNQTGVVYKNGAGTTINAAGSPYTVASGTTYTVKAFPASGYYFETSDDDEWSFTAD